MCLGFGGLENKVVRVGVTQPWGFCLCSQWKGWCICEKISMLHQLHHRCQGVSYLKQLAILIFSIVAWSENFPAAATEKRNNMRHHKKFTYISYKSNNDHSNRMRDYCCYPSLIGTGQQLANHPLHQYNQLSHYWNWSHGSGIEYCRFLQQMLEIQCQQTTQAHRMDKNKACA